MNRVAKLFLALLCLTSLLASPMAYFWGFQYGYSAQGGATAPMAAVEALRPLEALRRNEPQRAAQFLEGSIDAALARYQIFLDHPPPEFLLPLAMTEGNDILIRRIACYRVLHPYTSTEPLIAAKVTDVLARFPCMPGPKA